MGLFEIFVIGVGLSMDAFAVAVCKGLGMKRINWKHALIIAAAFGIFQALMPLLGWALGTQFAALIEPIDHWVAFALLVFIGGKMLRDAIKGEDNDSSGDGALEDAGSSGSAGAGSAACADIGAGTDVGMEPDAGSSAGVRASADAPAEKLDMRELLMLAIATSIDALAVGITLAFLGVGIWGAIAVIGVTTFVLSFVGVAIGNQFGSRFERPATIVGGIVLVLIGCKILLEHLGVLVL